MSNYVFKLIRGGDAARSVDTLGIGLRAVAVARTPYAYYRALRGAFMRLTPFVSDDAKSLILKGIFAADNCDSPLSKAATLRLYIKKFEHQYGAQIMDSIIVFTLDDLAARLLPIVAEKGWGDV